MAERHPVDQPNSQKGDFSPFAVLKVKVSDHLLKEQLVELAVLFELNPKELEQFQDSAAPGLAFLMIFEKRCFFTANNVDRFISGLREINNIQLAEIVEEYKRNHIYNRATSTSGSNQSSYSHAVNSGQSHWGPAAHLTVGISEDFHPGQNEPAVSYQHGGDQIVFPVDERVDYPDCVLTMDVSSDAMDSRTRGECASFRRRLLEHIFRTPSGYIDHLSDIFIFFRRLYGDLVRITSGSIQFHVRVPTLSTLHLLRKDCESGFVKDELTDLLLPREARAEMKRLNLYLKLQLEFESVKKVRDRITAGIADADPRGIQGMELFCDYCKVIFGEEWEHKYHIKSPEHLNKIAPKQGNEEWHHREPPSAITNGNFKICKIPNCQYFTELDAENHCVYAHTEDELKEWKARHAQRLKDIQSIHNQTQASQEKAKVKKSRRWSEKISKVNTGELLEIVGPISYNEKCKIADGSFESQIFVGSYKDEPVAVKRVLTSPKQKESELYELMKDTELNNVLQMLHIEKEKYVTHIVTPLCEFDLSEIVERQDSTTVDVPILTPEKRVSICAEILTGLKNLHSMEIVHRDLKPRNILLDVNLTAYVADFGISRSVRGQTTRYTTAMGTECWMASENCTVKEVRNTKESDVQVAAFLIYYVLSNGHHPFETTFPYTEDMEGVKEKLKNGDFSLEHIKDFPEAFKLLLESMLEKDPSARPTIGKCLEKVEAVLSSYTSSSQTNNLTNEDITLSLPDVKVICGARFQVFLPGSQQKKRVQHQCSWRIRVTVGKEKLEKVYLWAIQDENFYLSHPPEQSRPQECPTSKLQQDPRGGYTFTVHFTSLELGCFYAWLMFKFGEKTLCRQIIVWVGPDFAEHFPHYNDPSIPWDLGNHNVIRYPLPPDKFYEDLKEKFRLPKEQPESVELEPLTSDTFREYFHRMVYTEEWACIDKLRKYNGKLKMKLKDKVSNNQGSFMPSEDELFGEIHLGVRLDDSEASQVVQKWVHIILLKFDESGDVFEAKIADENFLDLREVDCFYVYLSSDCVQDKQLEAGKEVEVDVQFQVHRNMFCNFHFAIDNVTTKELLFPPRDMFPRFLEEGSTSVAENSTAFCLNHRQEEAKKFILDAKDSVPFRQGPSLIIGAFGTGKTLTLAKTVEDMLQQDTSSKILICTHSDSAADDFITKHLQDFLIKCPPETVLRQYAPGRKPDTVHHEIKKYCRVSQEQGMAKFVKPTAKIVSGYRVVVTTLATSIYLTVLAEIKGVFTHIFIDEAGQALETETMIPLGLAGPRTVVVLAGDHKQMRPKVFSVMARKHDFKPSLLERLYNWSNEYNCNITHFLTDNYRMIQEILDFIGPYCYQVKQFSSKVKEKPQTNFYPVAFAAVKGTEELEGLSYKNEKEATEIVNQIKQLLTQWPKEWGNFAENKIVVLTPYKLQVELLKKILKNERLEREIPVETIENVQGRQFQAVYISPVRTVQTASKGDYFGVLSDEGELITAFTRAKSYLFVVGDPVSLCSVGDCKEIWKKYLQVCEQHKSLKPNDVSYKSIEEKIAENQSNKDVNLPESVPPSGTSEMSSLAQQSEQQQEIPCSPGSLDGDSDIEFEEIDEDELEDEIIKEMNIQVQRERQREDSESASASSPTEPLVKDDSDEETLQQPLAPSHRGRNKWIKFRLVEGEEMLNLVGIKFIDSSDKSKREGGYDPDYVEEGPEEMDEEQREMYIQKTKDEPDRYCICVLRFAENYLVHAVPVSNHSASKIRISSKRKRKRALDGDQVVVHTWRKNDITYGEVMCILKRAEKLRWKQIVCTVDSENVGLLCPVGNPRLPKMYIYKGAKRVAEGSQDIKIRLHSIKPKRKPMIKHERDVVIKFKEMAHKLFVVHYSKWFSTCPYPMGIITEELPLCNTLESGIHILKLIHGVKAKWPVSLLNRVSQQFPESWEIPKDEMKRRKKFDFREKSIFTIGKSDLRDHDHAMHIETQANGRVVLGLHLADVPFFVEKDSDMDKEALSRGSSFYAPFSKPSHMLPHKLSTQFCNFSINHDRLSVSILLTFDQSGTSVEESIICRSIVNCKQNLTYENVENFLLNRNFDQNFDFKRKVTVMQQVEMLFKLTAPICQPQAVRAESEDQINFPLAYELVEGVRKIVTTEVAKKLNCESQSQLPVCRQLPPQQQDLEDWCQTYKEYVCTISHLPSSLALTREDTGSTAEMLPVLKSTWQEIEQAVKSDRDKVLELKRILTCKDGHPKQAVALAQLDTITPAEEFFCIGNDKRRIHHFSLQEDDVYPFMAPTRSYMDLVVLRMLVACLEKSPNPYCKEDLSHVAYHCSKQTQIARRYEKRAQMFVFALKLKSVPHQLEALVQNASEDELAFLYPFRVILKNSHSSTHVPLRLLKPGKRPKDGRVEGRSVQLNWRNRIYSYRSEASVIRDNKSVFWLFTDVHVRNIPVSFLDAMLESVERKEYDRVEQFQVEWDKIEKGESSRSTLPEDSRSQLIKEVTCERMRTNEGLSELRKYVEFNRQFNPGHVVELQLCAGFEQGILSPMVQLFKLTPKFDLCLEHRGMPVECFTEIADKLPAKCETISEYVRAWLPLLKMMVAYNTIMNDETIHIQNVSISWSKEKVGFDEETVYGRFSLGKDWCDERQITFGILKRESTNMPIHGFKDPINKFSVAVTDYICVRLHGYEISKDQQSQLEQLGSKSCDSCLKTDIPAPKKSTFVLHGVAGTTNVGSKAKVEEYDVEFQVTHKSCEIPNHLFEGDGKSTKEVKCTVELIPKSEPEKRMETALDKIENSHPLIVNIVLQNPEKIQELKDDDDILSDLLKEGSKIQDKSFQSFFGKLPPNRSQLAALRLALSQPFTVIQGPPGTGKTRTGAYLTSFFAQINKKVHRKAEKESLKPQILYCGPSNKSVDVITEYLQKFEDKLKLKFVRVYSDTIEQQTYPVPGVESAERKFGYVESTQMSGDVKKHALHHVIRSNETGGNGKQIRKYDQDFKEGKIEPNLKNVREYKKLVADTKLSILKKRDIILCTCNAAGHYMFENSLNIYQCIIDEAGMCFELDTLIPLVSQTPKQVVLIGDHKQLRPIIQDLRAKQLGADISLMEKFESMANTLTIQYRMHEEICKFPSQEFYDSKLETDVSVKKRGKLLPLKIWPGKDHHPRVFCHVEGTEDAQTVRTAEGNEMSRSNEEEANEVVRIANTLISKLQVEPKNLIILSQYRLQCMIIKNKLKSRQSLKGVTVQTIIKSQGSEWDIVILSTVRSLPEEDIPESPGKSWKRQNLGFIEDENQMNVGLTRAKRGLIIVGNQHLLRTCTKWKKLIEHYRETGSVVEAHQFLKTF